MILDKILADKVLEVEFRKTRRTLDDLKAEIDSAPTPRDFARAISGGHRTGSASIRVPRERVNLISEIKKASPSKGLIRADFDPLSIARIYDESGASAISVLTDEKYFHGRLEYLELVRNAVKLPCLRKDFIIDPYQIYEARASHADAVLLIVAALSSEKLVEFMGIASQLGMTSLVEVHRADELETALDAGASVIGVNNRDLQTFRTTIETTELLAHSVPDDRVLVSESGIFTHGDVVRLAAAGVDAILVGESLMREPDPSVKIKELLGVG